MKKFPWLLPYFSFTPVGGCVYYDQTQDPQAFPSFSHAFEHYLLKTGLKPKQSIIEA